MKPSGCVTSTLVSLSFQLSSVSSSSLSLLRFPITSKQTLNKQVWYDLTGCCQ